MGSGLLGAGLQKKFFVPFRLPEFNSMTENSNLWHFAMEQKKGQRPLDERSSSGESLHFMHLKRRSPAPGHVRINAHGSGPEAEF